MTHPAAQSRYAVVLVSEIADAQTLCEFVGQGAFDQARAKHDRIAAQLIDGVDDAEMLSRTELGFVASFKRAGDAVNTALKFQHMLRTESWAGQPITVRMGIHQGEIRRDGERWVGRAVDVAHCMMHMAIGGQLLLTHTVADDAQPRVQRHPRVDASLTPQIKWISHGRYTLTGGAGRIEVFEVGAEEFAPLIAPSDSGYATRLGNGGSEPSAAASRPTGASIGGGSQPGDASRPSTAGPAASQVSPPARELPPQSPRDIEHAAPPRDASPLGRAPSNAGPAEPPQELTFDDTGAGGSGATDAGDSLPTIARLGAGATEFSDVSPSPLPTGMSPGGAGSGAFTPPAATPARAKDDEATAAGPPSDPGEDATTDRPLRAAAPTPGAIGRLGDYELLEQIGAGGMGRVFKARHIHMGKMYAVKVLQDNLASNPRFVDQFRHEARVMAELRHDHIAVAHPLSQDGDTYFLAMEYVVSPKGKPTTLQEEMESQPLKRFHEARVLRWATQIASALEYAHNRRVSAEVDHHGVVHRDIKPANILLDEQGSAKLTDFGLAKLVGTSVTGKRGTPGYMAPEQCDPEGVIDERTDIYAFGAMIYKMLTGRRPDGSIMPPTQAAPGVDPRWDAVILKCLQRDPAQRYQNIADMLVDLTHMTHGKPVGRLPGRRIMIAAAAAVLVLVVGVTGLMLLNGNDAPADPGPDDEVARSTPANDAVTDAADAQPDTATAAVIDPPPPPPIELQLAAISATGEQRTVLYDGDRLLVRMETDRPAYLTLFGVDAGGDAIMLLPNALELDTKVMPHTPRIVPRQGGEQGLNFDVGKPYGEMRLIALATHEPVEVDGVDSATFTHAAVAFLPRGMSTGVTVTGSEGPGRKHTLDELVRSMDPELGAASQIRIAIQPR